jgi:hypothetical protein
VRTSSPPIAPNSALSGYFFSRVKDTGASRINNIPPPSFPLLVTVTASNSRSGSGNSPAKSDDIDVPDAHLAPPLPPATTPGAIKYQRTSEESSPHNEQTAPVADNSTENSPDNAIPSTPVDRDNRPQLQPRRQQDRQRNIRTLQPKTDWVDEITMEENTPENNLPVGYLGTFRGSRHFIPEFPGMLPCSNNYKHVLVCGHWIDSSEICGSNCRKPNPSQKPFNCPTCHDIVRKILHGSFTATDATRLRNFRENSDQIFLACCVEQVTRAAPQLKTGITEAVAGLLLIEYGRACERTDNPDPEGLETIERIVREMQERDERKKRERFASENPLNTHDKRKNPGMVNMFANAGHLAHNAPTAHNEQPQCGFSTGDAEMQETFSATNKKQKIKLDNCREPITPQTRGTKRSSTSSYSSDDNASPFAFLPGNECLHAPTKKVYIPPSPTFGQASFLFPHSSIGAIVRKRESEVDVEMAGEFKKRRVESWRASNEEMKKKTQGFVGFTTVYDEDEDDL